MLIRCIVPSTPTPQVVDNQVVLVRTKKKDGYYALQIGAINHPKLKNVCVPNSVVPIQEFFFEMSTTLLCIMGHFDEV